MSGIFKPNLLVLRDWRQTCTVAFQQLRRIPFLTEEIFAFGDFDPTIVWPGTATAVSVRRAKILKIWKFVFFSVDVRATLAVPFTQFGTLTIPYTARNDNPSSVQGAGAIVANAGTASVGHWQIASSTNLLTFYRAALAAFTAGDAILIANGFIEVE
jgi:hypothetical protein